jgi:hypothetical protein
MQTRLSTHLYKKGHLISATTGRKASFELVLGLFGEDEWTNWAFPLLEPPPHSALIQPLNSVMKGPSFSAFTAGRTPFLAWTAAKILSMRKGFHQFFFLLLFEASFLQTQALISVALLWKPVLILLADRKQEATMLWKPA